MRGSERFTQRASTAITKAHDAALGMGHSYVGTEHLLLGIIREGATTTYYWGAIRNDYNRALDSYPFKIAEIERRAERHETYDTEGSTCTRRS